MTGPFEVVADLTMKLGEPQPAFPREPQPPLTGELRVGSVVIGEWDDAEETPLQAIARLNTSVIEADQATTALQRDLAQERDQLHAARGTVEQRDSMLDDTRRELARTRRELDEFKATVREVAIRVADEQDWCNPGLNEVLRELGLPEKTVRWKVPITVTATQQVWVTVTAESEDEALSEVESTDVHDAVDSYDWEIGDWEKTEYGHIEPADSDD